MSGAFGEMSGPHRIGQCAFDFRFAPGARIGSPEALVPVAQEALLPAVADVLNGPNVHGRSANIAEIEIDLGTWPANPDWAAVRRLFRDRFEQALSGYLRADAQNGTRGEAQERAGDDPVPVLWQQAQADHPAERQELERLRKALMSAATGAAPPSRGDLARLLQGVERGSPGVSAWLWQRAGDAGRQALARIFAPTFKGHDPDFEKKIAQALLRILPRSHWVRLGVQLGIGDGDTKLADLVAQLAEESEPRDFTEGAFSEEVPSDLLRPIWARLALRLGVSSGGDARPSALIARLAQEADPQCLTQGFSEKEQALVALLLAQVKTEETGPKTGADIKGQTFRSQRVEKRLPKAILPIFAFVDALARGESPPMPDDLTTSQRAVLLLADRRFAAFRRSIILATARCDLEGVLQTLASAGSDGVDPYLWSEKAALAGIETQANAVAGNGPVEIEALWRAIWSLELPKPIGVEPVLAPLLVGRDEAEGTSGLTKAAALLREVPEALDGLEWRDAVAVLQHGEGAVSTRPDRWQDVAALLDLVTKALGSPDGIAAPEKRRAAAIAELTGFLTRPPMVLEDVVALEERLQEVRVLPVWRDLAVSELGAQEVLLEPRHIAALVFALRHEIVREQGAVLGAEDSSAHGLGGADEIAIRIALSLASTEEPLLRERVVHVVAVEDQGRRDKAPFLEALLTGGGFTEAFDEEVEGNLRALLDARFGVVAGRFLAGLELVLEAGSDLFQPNGTRREDWRTDPATRQAMSRLAVMGAPLDPDFGTVLERFLTLLAPDADVRRRALRVLGSRLSYTDGRARHGLRRIVQDTVNDLLAGMQGQALQDRKVSAPDISASRASEVAGLILFHPFLPQLFAAFGCEDGAEGFRKKDWPLVLAGLRYLSGQPGMPDWPDPLERVLMGLPDKAQFFGPPAVLTPSQRATTDGLLTSVIQHWSRLGQTSPAGLQEAFVRRMGRLREADRGPELRVAPGPFDVLLDSLPWAIEPMIALRWMRTPLWIRWRSEDGPHEG